ncbi:hypothetical protein [Rhodoflexus caldus]|uniref:hypothetical protein n=1 Tax=Rhodoflexus caldus TaxID=2891236 RepID=UPI00202AC111|nr:hypothetical protein [Rhodoflexus caldus]
MTPEETALYALICAALQTNEPAVINATLQSVEIALTNAIRTQAQEKPTAPEASKLAA